MVPSMEMLNNMSAEDMLATLKDLQPNDTWALFSPKDRDGEGYAICFLFDGCWISDPTLTDCGRFDADPVKDYGLCEDAAMTLLLVNEVLNERFNNG